MARWGSLRELQPVEYLVTIQRGGWELVWMVVHDAVGLSNESSKTVASPIHNEILLPPCFRLCNEISHCSPWERELCELINADVGMADIST
jgi:hypothetical protein